MTTIETDQPGSPPPRGATPFLVSMCLIVGLSGLLFGIDTAVVSGAIGDDQGDLRPGCRRRGLDRQFRRAGLRDRHLGLRVARRPLRTPRDPARGGRAVSRLDRRLRRAALGDRLVLARIVGGLGIGFASVVGPLYIAEISPPHLRGRMIALFQLAITVGILTAFASNALILRFGDRWAGDVRWLRWLLVDEMWRGMWVPVCCLRCCSCC